MKGKLLSSRIFNGILLLGVVALVVMFFTTGAAVLGTIALATGPLAVPSIKAKNLDDAEGLAKELNDAFGELAVGLKNAIEQEYADKGALSIKDLDAKLKGLGIETDTIKAINAALEDQGLEIEKNAGQIEQKGGLKAFISKAFNRDGLDKEIKTLFEKGSGMIDITKAVGTLTTGNVSTTTGGNAILDMLNADEINDLKLNSPFIEEFASVSNTNKPVYSYVDYIPGEGDVDFIAEGGTKPQLDLDVEVRTASPVKAAGYEVLTEESITDIPRMESNARNLLLKKYLLKRQNGILFGDGIGANPLGVTNIAAAFNPATWTGNKIPTPNLHDAVIACANQVYTAESYTDDVEYYPNVCFVNPSDYASLRVAKNADGNYIFPSFSLLNDQTIDGIRLISKNKIPAGKILIGDFTKLNIINYIAYSVRIGWINDQFIKNLFTMLGEGRFYVFVKNLDQRAFIYDDIANVIAGIEEVVA